MTIFDVVAGTVCPAVFRGMLHTDVLMLPAGCVVGNACAALIRATDGTLRVRPVDANPEFLTTTVLEPDTVDAMVGACARQCAVWLFG